MDEHNILSLYEAKQIIGGQSINMASLPYDKVLKSYDFLNGFARDRIIYGINTGFGPMAQWRVADDKLRELQLNLIRSHSTGSGKHVGDKCVKAAMLARLGTLIQGKSGVHPDMVVLLGNMINSDIIPFVPEHGSVGASGDLVQLAHIALAMIGEGKVHYKNEWISAREALSKAGLQPMRIYIREGLSMANGTSFMTGVGIINHRNAETLLDWSVLFGVWMNEIASSYDDFMSEALNAARNQPGQTLIARQMRAIAEGGSCMTSREHTLYDREADKGKRFERKVQAYYSLRCVPQILGPIVETIDRVGATLENELNSASDNPLADPETGNVYHGGNFHGDYISLDQDVLKIAVTRMTMTAERQLNYLLNDRINGILPPFLNRGTLGLNYGMQACQFTATSTTAESQTLSFPNYVHSIPNNQDNQDIVSMGSNSALICRKVIDNAFEVMAIHAMALTQASEILKIGDKLCPMTAAAAARIREISGPIRRDRPYSEDIARVAHFLKHEPLELNFNLVL